MNLKALVNFSYQNKSFKSGQMFSVEDNKMAELLLGSGHVVEAEPAKKAAK